jgi:hypothetical protein
MSQRKLLKPLRQGHSVTCQSGPLPAKDNMESIQKQSFVLKEGGPADQAGTMAGLGIGIPRLLSQLISYLKFRAT